MRRGFLSAFLTGLGAVLPNLFYALLALTGLSFLNSASIPLSIKAGGALTLFCVGLYDLRQAPEKLSLTHRSVPAVELARGAVLCITNPFCLLFWLAIIGFLRNHDLLGRGPHIGFLFLMGTACGDILFFILIAWVSSAIRHRSDTGLLRRINMAVSLLLIGFALYWSFDIIKSLTMS